MRILVIESDPTDLRSVELFLKADGFSVDSSFEGGEGAELASLYGYQSIVLADELDDMAALDVIRRLRLAKISTPIVVLARSPRLEDKLSAFRAGADDYLAKPFHREELTARLHAVIRRSVGQATTIISAGPIAIDLSAKNISVHGKPVHLTGREFALMEFLALRKGAAVTKEAILDQLYGGLDEPDMKIVDVFICKLRIKLRDAGADGHIETEWGRGYRLVDSPTVVATRVRVEPGANLRRLITARLARGDATFPELAALSTSGKVNSVRGAIQALAQADMLTNVGGPKSALYRLKAQRVAA